jgi:hypothetical protein
MTEIKQWYPYQVTKDVMVFYTEFIGDDTMSCMHHENLYFTETFLKSLFAKYTKS